MKKRGTGYFWWSLLLMLMTALCFASWVGSFYVVGHPENPRCHKILRKLNRLDPPARFCVTSPKAVPGQKKIPLVPHGEFFNPGELVNGSGKRLEGYGKLGPAVLERENAELLRAYLMNYRETKRPVVYVSGKFDTVATYPLGPGDMFPSGVAVIAQAIEFPQVLLEIVMPSRPETVATICKELSVGSDITLKRSTATRTGVRVDLYALIHVARVPEAEGRMQFTVVPLLYEGWKSASASFTLRSPAEVEEELSNLGLNIEASLPIVRPPRLQKGIEDYIVHRRKAFASVSGDQSALTRPELIRFEVTSDNPDVAISRVVRTAPTPPAAAQTIPPPAPASQATAPPRRAFTTAQASGLLGEFDPTVPAVLTGEFVVTGINNHRVGLRTTESLRDPNSDPKTPGTNGALIVVDFPADTAPPALHSTISRGAEDGFPIRDVVRLENGQIAVVTAAR